MYANLTILLICFSICFATKKCTFESDAKDHIKLDFKNNRNKVDFMSLNITFSDLKMLTNCAPKPNDIILFELKYKRNGNKFEELKKFDVYFKPPKFYHEEIIDATNFDLIQPCQSYQFRLKAEKFGSKVRIILIFFFSLKNQVKVQVNLHFAYTKANEN